MRVLAAVMAGLGLAAFDMRVMAGNTEDRIAVLEKEVSELKALESAGEKLSVTGLGGYGELHYNNLNGEGGAKDLDLVDFHRFVIFLNHKFSDRIRFSSELEVEHALSGDDQPGEVELEQAYIDFDINDSHTVRSGLFLLPVGILNETHEPTTFYGVERNPVESRIIPTTWWEAGAGAYGTLVGDLSYAAYLHSGLLTSTNSSYSVRSGRQKVATANASDPAGTMALVWRYPGITLGGSLQYQSDMTQSTDSEAKSAYLGEVHADLRKGRFGLRALYAEWIFDGDGPKSLGVDKQFGWYIEPSLRLVDCLGIFTRYNVWNNTAGDMGKDGEKSQTDIGVNLWPHEQVVIKADYQWQSNDNGKNQNGFNIGIGYAF